MSPGALRGLTLAWLVLSLLLSGLILAYDGLLWADNPKTGHAYALIGFGVIDLVLLVLVVGMPKVGLQSSFVWGLVQLVLMLANPLTAGAIGLSPGEFANYLFGLKPYSGSPKISCPYLCPPFAYSYDALMLLQLLLAITAYVGWKKARPVPPAELKAKP